MSFNMFFHAAAVIAQVSVHPYIVDEFIVEPHVFFVFFSPLYTNIPSISGSSAFPRLPENLGLTLTAYQILHFTAFFSPTVLSAGNIIHIFIPLWMQVSL